MNIHLQTDQLKILYMYMYHKINGACPKIELKFFFILNIYAVYIV